VRRVAIGAIEIGFNEQFAVQKDNDSVDVFVSVVGNAGAKFGKKFLIDGITAVLEAPHIVVAEYGARTKHGRQDQNCAYFGHVALIAFAE
jgi:hypothetical protein